LRGKTVDKYKYDQWKEGHKADVADEEMKETSFHGASLHVIQDDSSLHDSPRFKDNKEDDKRLIDDT
jgi:hypothetical protein